MKRFQPQAHRAPGAHPRASVWGVECTDMRVAELVENAFDDGLVYISAPSDAICHPRHLTSFKRRHGAGRIKTKNTFFMFARAFTMHSTTIFSHSENLSIRRNCTGRRLEDRRGSAALCFAVFNTNKKNAPAISHPSSHLPSK